MKKYIALTLSFVLIFLLSACGSETGITLPQKEQSNRPDPTNALEQIQYDGVLTVAVSPDYSPMEFVDSSKSGQEQYVGFDISVASYLARELGVELKIKPLSYEGCRDAVYGGAVPISLCAYLQSQESNTYCEVSDPYFARDNSTDTVLLLRQDDLEKYTAVESFTGVSVAVQKSSQQEDALNQQLVSAKVTGYAEISEAVGALLNKKVEALAVSRENARQILAANDGLAYCTWQFSVSDQDSAYVVLIQKGESQLLDKVNELLAKAQEDGLYEQWYQEALTQSESPTATVMVME